MGSVFRQTPTSLRELVIKGPKSRGHDVKMSLVDVPLIQTEKIV